MSPFLSPGDTIRLVPGLPSWIGSGTRVVVGLGPKLVPAIWTDFGRMPLAGNEALFTILPRPWEQPK